MKIVGIGNVILDYYFFDDKIYMNGGGTVSNILCNLSVMKIKTKLIGYYGIDPISNIGILSLKKAGVDVSSLEQKNYETKKFYIDSTKTTSICPYCKRKTKNYLLKRNIQSYLQGDDIVLIQDYVFLKNISNRICLDLGYVKKMIYLKKEEIEEFIFRSYYIVSMKETALLFLLKRLEIGLEEFLKKCNIYMLLITKGNRGVTIVFQNQILDFKTKPLEELETNGCGDIFFATFISETIKRKNITICDIEEIYRLALNNVEIILKNIGARNHVVPNIEVEKGKKCICEEVFMIN